MDAKDRIHRMDIQTIREVTEEDAFSLAQFFEDNNTPEVTRQFSPFPLTAETASRIARDRRRDRYYIGLDRGKIVALAMLRGWDEGFEIPSFGICVDRRYRRRGIGRAMTQFSIAAARALGATSIRLSVYASNARAIGLYEGLGFHETERRPVSVAGTSDVKIVMAREL